MYWLIYICCSIVVAHMISRYLEKYYLHIFFLVSTLLLTPSQISISDQNLAPSIYTFLFNFIFERNFSLRPLRPLILTLPLSILLSFIVFQIKKRFF